MFVFKLHVFFFTVAFLMIQYTYGNYQNDLAIIDSIKQEKECIHQGGMCVIEKDCPHLTAVRGLCPKQRSQGVECCYGISVKETRCQMRGGECFPNNYCSPQVQLKATDCKDNQVCCLLL